MAIDAVLLDIAPETASVDAAQRSRVIALAQKHISNAVFGDLTELAVAYLAAHMLTMSKRGGAGGAVTSESEGALSRSYAVPTSTASLNATSYGQDYLSIRRAVVLPVITGYGNG